MSKIPIDGNVKVTFFPTCADTSAPTVDELTAAGAADIECDLTADGWTANYSEDTKDTSTFCSTFNATEPGRIGGNIALKYFEDSVATDGAKDTLVQNTRGFVALRVGVAHDTDWAAADKALVYPIMCGPQKLGAMPANSDKTWEQTLYMSDDPEIDATVAAGSS